MAKAAKIDKGQQKETLVKVLKYMKPIDSGSLQQL